MSIEAQQMDKDKTDSPKHAMSSRRLRLILTIIIAIMFTVLIGIAQVLGNLQIIPAIWATISSAIVGVSGAVFAFIALLPILFPSEHQGQQVTHIPVPVIISGGTAHVTSTPISSVDDAISQFHHLIVQPYATSTLKTSDHKTAFRGIVGFLPPTDTRTIQQRTVEVEEVYTELTRPDVTAIVLTGISGVGKSTLAALIYQHSEALRAIGTGFFQDEPIWLTINFDTTMVDVVGTIFEKLGLPLPDLDQQSPHYQASELFNTLNSVDKSRLIVLDQFENLLDAQTGCVLVERPGVGEWLDIINSQLLKTGCRLLLTSRVLPKGTHAYPLTYLQEYCSEGLAVDEGIDLLKKQVTDVNASEKDLHLIVERCNGHAYALTLLASLLRNHHIQLNDLFSNAIYEELWEGDIAHNFLDYIYENQLNFTQRQLLQTFSVYREAVPLTTVQETLDPTVHISKKELLTTVRILLNLHLLQAREGRYTLHALIAQYARHHFDAENEQHNHQLLQDTHARAALYYQHHALIAYPPRGERHTIKDLQPLIEATWQFIHAARCPEAYALMEKEELFTDLDRLGGAAILLELYDLLFPLDNWHATPIQIASIYKHCGRVHSRIQARSKSLEYYQQALDLYKAIGDNNGQCEVLIYLGEAWHDSDIAHALKVNLEALELARVAGHRKHEAAVLNNLSWMYKGMGELEKGRTSGEQALGIYHNLGDRWGESRCFDALGGIYNALGLQEQALASLEQALQLYKELGNRWQEGWMLIHLGSIYNDQGQKEQAQKQYEQALDVGKQVGNQWVENAALNGLGKILHTAGKQQQAREYYEQALQGTRKIQDSWGEGSVLHNLGKLAYEQKQQQQALTYLNKAFTINKEIGNYLEVIATLHDVSAIYVDLQRYDIALALLLMVRTDYGNTQSFQLNKIHALYTLLQNTIGADKFSDLLAQVEPHYPELVKQALDC